MNANALEQHAARERVLLLLTAARRIADPADELGRSARQALASSRLLGRRAPAVLSNAILSSP